MLFSPIAQDRTADAAIRQVELAILRGILRPGDRLPGERDLADSLGLSRPVLREALKELEARGLVAARPGGGTYVGDVIGTVFSEPMAQLIRRHPEATDGYFEYRREMEAWASALAAERATAPDKAALAAIVAAMDAAHGEADPAEETRLDWEFHTAIGEATHNLVLLHTLRACYRLVQENVFYDRARLFAVPQARDALLRQHHAILAAIIAGDAAAARSAAIAHIDFVEAAVREVELGHAREAVARARLDQRASRARRGPKGQRAASEPASSVPASIEDKP